MTAALVLVLLAGAGVGVGAGLGRLLRRWAGRWWWVDLGVLVGVYGAAIGVPALAALLAGGSEASASDVWFAPTLLLLAVSAGCTTVACAAAAGVDLGTVPVPRARLLAGVGVGLLGPLWSVVLSGLHTVITGGSALPDQLATDALGPALPTAARVLAGVASVALVPLLEELLFRGVAFGILARRFGVPLALTVTAFVFALSHGTEPVLFAATASFGVAWGWLRAWSGSVWPGVAAHVVNNGVAVLGALIAGG